MSDRPRRKATYRNLPVLLLIWGVIFAAVALCRPFASNSFLPKEKELRTISGIVQRAPYITRPGRGGHKLQIFVLGGDGLHHLTQDDMGHLVPGIMDPIMKLRVGDKVIARVEHDPFGRYLDWLWEMQRGDTTILSYQDTHLFMERRNVRIRQLCNWAGILAFVSLAAAIFLKRHFGSWRETEQSAESKPLQNA
jgi:hypothetical protein